MGGTEGSGEATIFYGLAVNLVSLMRAACAYSNIAGGLSLLSDLQDNGAESTATLAVNRVPTEIWQRIEGDLIRSAVADEEAKRLFTSPASSCCGEDAAKWAALVGSRDLEWGREEHARDYCTACGQTEVSSAAEWEVRFGTTTMQKQVDLILDRYKLKQFGTSRRYFGSHKDEGLHICFLGVPMISRHLDDNDKTWHRGSTANCYSYREAEDVDIANEHKTFSLVTTAVPEDADERFRLLLGHFDIEAVGEGERQVCSAGVTLTAEENDTASAAKPGCRVFLVGRACEA
ncbi:hypothetical protein JCM11251_005399 [Rhodosporidiobolus azoricus]